MLRIKYFEEFKNESPFIVVISDLEGLKDAYSFFKDKSEAYLNDSFVTEFSDIYPLDNSSLNMDDQECSDISEHFKNLYESGEPGHLYFDIAALGDQIEVIISYGEYDGLF